MKRIALLITLAIAAIACQKEEPVVPNLELTDPEATLSLPTEGGSTTIGFTVNVDWKAMVKDAEWCTVTPLSGTAGTAKVTVLAEENKSNDSREAIIVLTAGEGKVVKEVKVTQVQKDALLLEGEKNFEIPMEGGEIRLTVNHNVPYTLETPAWIEKPDTKAMVKDALVFKVAAQEEGGKAREGKIIIKNTVKDVEIKVNQAEWIPMFDIKDKKTVIPSAGGEGQFTVQANIAFTVKGKADWGSLSNKGNVYSFKANGANTTFSDNTVKIDIVPEKEAYKEFATSITIIQEGKAKLLWSCNPAGDFEKYAPGNVTRLSKYGDFILFSNLDKVFAVNPETGKLVQTFNLPEGMTAQHLFTDDAGNILVSANMKYQQEMNVYIVEDISKPAPKPIITYNTGNYYGTDTGNVRVKGNVKKDAVVTAVVSDGAGGAMLYWEIKDGVVAPWSWTNVPYAVASVNNGCAIPAGTTADKGMFYIGYNGDYNLKYLASPVKGGNNTWTQSCVTGGTWMENWNCLSMAEFNGKKYVAAVMGCHFDYDATDVILMDVTDVANGKIVYKLSCDSMVERNKDWKNMDWVGKGTFSDVLLTADGDKMHLYFTDMNFNIFGGVEFTK